MKLENLGFSDVFRNQAFDTNLSIARVVAEHKERYILNDGDLRLEAEITGNMRFSANQKSDFPVIGDFVSFMKFDNNQAIIHHIFQRKSLLERKAVGKFGENQAIAANLDFALIMQAVDRDFNLNRLDRYITVCKAGNIKPICLLNKIDLINKNEVHEKVNQILKRHPKIKVISVSNWSKTGYDVLQKIFIKQNTYAVLGSSGVGKSTLINHLKDSEYFATSEISRSTKKGKHTTTHKELVMLDNGAILIDTPGLREIGITESSEALQETFSEIQKIASSCKFQDCTHINEPGCAVQIAIERGDLDPAAFNSYKKLEREAMHAKNTIAEKRKKDKEFGKMIKSVLNEKKKNKHY